MNFVGIDLAWSDRNPSGVAVIDSEGKVICASGDQGTVEDILAFAGLIGHQEAVVAIDAPLIVSNRTGQRPVENQLGKLFAVYDAGAHSSNLTRKDFQEGGRIHELMKRLKESGFVHLPEYRGHRPQKVVLEVFPHPAQVILFPSERRRAHFHTRALRYKVRGIKKRPWAEIHSEWEIYRARLRSLQYRKPALTFSNDVMQAINVDINSCTGNRYKHFDDLLDGIFCAYLAYYFWYWGDERCCVVGDMEAGYVALPRCGLPNCELSELADL